MTDILAIILAGGRDFGRCPLASRKSPGVWSVGPEAVITHLLRRLQEQSITRAVICSDGFSRQFQSVLTSMDGLQVDYLDETMPLGTAGSIRQVLQDRSADLLLVLHAGLISPPDNFAELIHQHRTAACDLSVILQPRAETLELDSDSAGIYICQPSIVEQIPSRGYSDIKEGLIPDLLKAGKIVRARRLDRSVGNFRDRCGYLRALAVYFANNEPARLDIPWKKIPNGDGLWLAEAACIAESARLFGPVMILPGAKVSDDVVIVGPAVIGGDVQLAEGCLVTESVVWEKSRIGNHAVIRRSIIADNLSVSGNSHLEKTILARKRRTMRLSKAAPRPVGLRALDKAGAWHVHRVKGDSLTLAGLQSTAPAKAILPGLALALLAGFIWSYRSTLDALWDVWMRSDEYSCGILVPFMLAYVLWLRRDRFLHCPLSPSWWGLVGFALAQFLRNYFGVYLGFSSADNLSLVLSGASLVLLLGGWRFFRQALPLVLFSLLMLPFPHRFEQWITLPLQHWATTSAVFSLEVLGFAVTRNGNVIHIGSTSVAVAEACNGLRMLTAFFIISSLVVLLVNRKFWEKVVILLSALPIALLCNTIRLAVTSIIFTRLTGEQWEKLFHDFGGYAMMPLALALIVLELRILTKLTTVPDMQNSNMDILVTPVNN